MKKIPLSSVTMRTPFHMPVVGQHETYATDLAERQCEMNYIPSLQVVELATDKTEKRTVIYVPMTNVVKMVPTAEAVAIEDAKK